MFKRFICYVLTICILLSFAACSSEQKTDKKIATSYEEKDIGKDLGINMPWNTRINSKNQLVVNDLNSSKKQFLLLDLDGKPAGEIKYDFKESVTNFALDSKDNIYAIAESNINDSEIMQKLYILSPDGKTITSCDLGKYSTKSTTERGITGVLATQNGDIYLASPKDGVKILDNNGKFLKSVGSPGITNISLDADGNILAYSYDVNKPILQKIDPAKGKVIWKQDLSSTSKGYTVGASKIVYSIPDNSIYLLTDKDIVMYDSNGKLLGKVLEFSKFSILSTGSIMCDMNIDTNKNIYITAISKSSKAEGNKLFKYSPLAEGGKQAEQKTISLFTRNVDEELQIAASKFQEINPGYKIDIQTLPEGQSSEDTDKYINNLNSSILAGKGPDILVTGKLPYEKYIDKNMLVNLSDLIAKDKSFDSNKYFGNIIDGMKYKGNLYTMPVSFIFFGMMANEGVLEQEGIKIDDTKWTWNDFGNVIKKVTKPGTRTALPNINCEELFTYIMQGRYPQFINSTDRTSKFNSDKFLDMLNFIKTHGKPDAPALSIDAVEAAQRGSVVFMPEMIVDFNTYALMKTVFNDKMKIYNFPSMESNGAGIFNTMSTYAINVNSQYKDKAWEFIKLMLSDDIQSQLLVGFPVNKAVLQTKAKELIENTASGKDITTFGDGSRSIQVTYHPFTQTDVDYLTKILQNLKIYSNIDPNIRKILDEECTPVFSGDKSPEAAAKIIQNKVNTLLGE
ncbi:MAG: extracellular solute-binding protein [Bacillota bacterium]|nr:extracellular solute-binding protein [Bacillota bacterium]